MIHAINRLRIAEHFKGWTLEYIDQLSPFDRADILGLLEGDAKAKE